MRVVIVGAGEVGSSIAQSLADTHEVVVLDVDAERVDQLQYGADVLAMQGDGTELDTLLEAGVDNADLLIASTDDDETNMVTCGTAKTLGDPFTIARVKDTKFLNTWRNSDGAFGVDFMVGTNLLTAETIVRVIGLPAAIDVEPFAEGRVQMAEFGIEAESPVAGHTVQEADRWDSLTFAAVIRNGDVVIPGGDTVIEDGDNVVVIGSPGSVKSFAGDVAPDVSGASNVLVVGGSDIGYHTARLLEQEGLSPRLVERDQDRARSLAEQLPGTTVLQSDATDREFLDREHVEDVDVVVAALDSDEKNLLTSLLARRMGAERSVAIVDNGEYVPLFEAVGVDVAVNPREATAEEITRFTLERHAENVAIIESDRAEVLEIEIDDESVLAGRPIRESIGDLPDGVVIGAITRDGSLVTPRGDTVVERGDHVVAFIDADVIDEATRLL
jgi:trk system potassium uptake protein TrkA